MAPSAVQETPAKELAAKPMATAERKPKKMSELEKTKAAVKKWEKEQEKIERLNKKLGKINKDLAIAADAGKKQGETTMRAIHICIPCKRKFQSLVGLQNHFDKSTLHMVLLQLITRYRKT